MFNIIKKHTLFLFIPVIAFASNTYTMEQTHKNYIQSLLQNVKKAQSYQFRSQFNPKFVDARKQQEMRSLVSEKCASLEAKIANPKEASKDLGLKIVQQALPDVAFTAVQGAFFVRIIAGQGDPILNWLGALGTMCVRSFLPEQKDLFDRINKWRNPVKHWTTKKDGYQEIKTTLDAHAPRTVGTQTDDFSPMEEQN